MPPALPLFVFFGYFPTADGCRKQSAPDWLVGGTQGTTNDKWLQNVGLWEAQEDKKTVSSLADFWCLALDRYIFNPLG